MSSAQSVPMHCCPNGHGPGSDGARFCTRCGANLVPAPGAAVAAGTPVLTGSGAPPCPTCGGDGARLAHQVIVCPGCRWLRPLAPGYAVDPSAFQWAADGAAMARLRSIGPLLAAARAVSDRAGRRWIESTFNAVRLGERQLPEVYHQAVRAARLLGMPAMPDVYVCGDRMWDAVTYGSDSSAFVLIGSALVNSFREDDLLFLLAREMGHCRAGHALWKTVGTFLLGQQGPRKGLMANGLLAALNPGHLVEGALEMPLLAWARQAEITADRAGLLAVGDEDAARRVLLSWSLRSIPLYQRINLDAWLEQQEDSEDQLMRLSEIISSPTPYITRRLKLLNQFAQSAELRRARAIMTSLSGAGFPACARFAAAPAQKEAPAGDFAHLACPNCQAAMRVPRAALEGRELVNVRCPNAGCGKIVTLKRKPVPAAPSNAVAPGAMFDERNTDE
jgi:Zn-dependent protease with chaperone function